MYGSDFACLPYSALLTTASMLTRGVIQIQNRGTKAKRGNKWGNK